MTQSILLAAAAILFLSACDGRTKISETASFPTAAPASDRFGGRSIEQVIWATEKILIATARNQQIQAFDSESGKQLWSQKFTQCIDAITCNQDHVFVALNASYPYKDKESIRLLDVATGADSTPKGIPQPFLVEALVWSPELKALCLLENEGLWIFSPDLLSVKTRIPYSGRLPFVTSDGKSILLAERSESCSLIDLKTESISHIYGSPHKKGDSMIATDTPFLSNAFHSTGGPLIRIIDNSWATGRIYFHPTPKDTPKESDSKNGHAVAAVHWPTSRLVVSGTEKNLLLFSTSGTLLGNISGATTERTYSLAFSPSGTKIAALSSDGRIKIFTAP